MRTGAVRLLVSLLIGYFVGLVYFGLNAGTYAGVEGYGLLLLLAIVFAALATQDKARFGAGFLVFLNASWIFFLLVGVAFLLDLFNIISLPITKTGGTPDLGLWLFSFGVWILLFGFYQFGFNNKNHRFIFAWAETNPSMRGIATT